MKVSLRWRMILSMSLISKPLFLHRGLGRVSGRRKSLGQEISGLEKGCRAERKAFLAVMALLQGNFRDEPDLPPGSTNPTAFFFYRVNTGDNESFLSANLCFYDANSATPKRLQFFVVTECGYRYSCTLSRLQDGHPFLCSNFFSINLQTDFKYSFLLDKCPFILLNDYSIYLIFIHMRGN